MNNTFKLLVIPALFTLFTNTFADEIACPQAPAVKTAKFTQAFENPYQAGVWYLVSDAITIDGNPWNVWFGTVLPAKTPDQAIKQGQAFFNKSPLFTPNSYYDGKNTTCNYVGAMKYFVAAINPPLYSFPTN